MQLSFPNAFIGKLNIMDSRFRGNDKRVDGNKIYETHYISIG